VRCNWYWREEGAEKKKKIHQYFFRRRRRRRTKKGATNLAVVQNAAGHGGLRHLLPVHVLLKGASSHKPIDEDRLGLAEAEHPAHSLEEKKREK
jgi:hypothetical protein